MEAFWAKNPGARKLYTKGRTIKWVVECESFSMGLLMARLTLEVSWDSAQIATVWLLDKSLGHDVRLSDESQLPAVLNMYKENRFLTLLVVVLSSGVALTLVDSNQDKAKPA